MSARKQNFKYPYSNFLTLILGVDMLNFNSLATKLSQEFEMTGRRTDYMCENLPWLKL